MVTGVIQFREDERELQFLRAQGINPNELAREAFEQAVRIVRAKSRAEAIRRLRVRVPKGIDVASLIRRDRDTHHAKY